VLDFHIERKAEEGSDQDNAPKDANATSCWGERPSCSFPHGLMCSNSLSEQDGCLGLCSCLPRGRIDALCK